MIAHAMKYVAMCEKMAAAHPERASEFKAVAQHLREAETEAVRAYLRFKALLRDVEGSELAERYINETYWDLT